jgi:hypothetical protein
LLHGVCNRVPEAGEIACQCKYVTEHGDIQKKKKIRESYSLFVANSTEGNPGNQLLVTFIVPKNKCEEGRYGKNVNDTWYVYNKPGEWPAERGNVFHLFPGI